MSTAPTLPSPETMHRALVERDSKYDGLFITGVKTTGIFCRPTCPAKKPKPENVEFFANTRKAGAERVRTMVDWGQGDLLHFFRKFGFMPGSTIVLERHG